MSSLNLQNTTKLGKEEQKKVQSLLNSIYDNSDASEFRNPVDWKGYGLLDYLQIVKKPIDLGTIKRNLRDGKYQYVEEVLNDIQLVWDNCKIYNQKGSVYLLDSNFGRKIRKINASINQKLFTIYKHLYNICVFNAILLELIQTSHQQQQKQVAQPEVEYEKKIKFSTDLTQLTEPQLAQIVETIQNECPNCFVEVLSIFYCIQFYQVDKGRYQMLIDLIPLETFNKLEKYELLSMINELTDYSHKKKVKLS